MLRNYALLWSKHNHGKISPLSGESPRISENVNLLASLVLSWLTVQLLTKCKRVFGGFYYTPEGPKMCLDSWRKM